MGFVTIDKLAKTPIILVMTTYTGKTIAWLLILAILLAPVQHVFALPSHDEAMAGVDVMAMMAMADDKGGPHCEAYDSFNNGSCNDCEMCAHCAAPAPLGNKLGSDCAAEQPSLFSLPFHSFSLPPEHRPPRHA